jgi:hypothetical protein
VHEFKKVVVHCFESSTMGPRAHVLDSQFRRTREWLSSRRWWFTASRALPWVCAKWALKKVCNQLSQRIKGMPFSVLLTTVYDPSRWDTNYTKYLEVTTVEENKNTQMVNRCMLAQDQVLY